MPPSRGAPAPKLSKARATAALIIAITCDALKLFFDFFGFSGPALVGLATSGWFGGGAVGAAAGAVVGSVSFLIGGGAFEMFGAIMAMIMSFIGWSLCTLLLWGIWGKPSNFLLLLFGWTFSEVPFINILPTISGPVWRAIRNERAAERIAKKESEKENQEALKKQRAREAQRLQVAQQQIAIAQAANEQAEEEAEAPPIPV